MKKPLTDMNRGEIGKVSGILSERGNASKTESRSVKHLKHLGVWVGIMLGTVLVVGTSLRVLLIRV